MAEIGLPLTRH